MMIKVLELTVSKITILILLVFIVFSIFILYCDDNLRYELEYDNIYGRVIQIDTYYYSLYYKCEIVIYVDNHYENFVIECKGEVDYFLSNYTKGSLIDITRISKYYQYTDTKKIIGYDLNMRGGDKFELCKTKRNSL